jgi:hypothetical protein
MKTLSVQLLALSVMAFGLGTIRAQQHDHQAPARAGEAKPAQPAPAAAAGEPQELFCATMTTGQLCSHGTVAALGLTAAKRDAWLAAVNKFNKAVNEATVALQSEARGALSAAQMAEVNRWFAVGLNQQINQLLAAPAKAKRTK